MDYEIVSLNAEDLDVYELERRLELAMGMYITDGWVCGKDCGSDCGCNGFDSCRTDICGAECTNLCAAKCHTFCAGDLCTIDGCGTL